MTSKYHHTIRILCLTIAVSTLLSACATPQIPEGDGQSGQATTSLTEAVTTEPTTPTTTPSTTPTSEQTTEETTAKPTPAPPTMPTTTTTTTTTTASTAPGEGTPGSDASETTTQRDGHIVITVMPGPGDDEADPDDVVTLGYSSRNGRTVRNEAMADGRFNGMSTFPKDYDDVFSNIEINAETRRDILNYAVALEGLPYIYPHKSIWWAPETYYNVHYDNLWESRMLGGQEGLPSYVYGADCSAFIKAVMDYAIGSKMHDYVLNIHGAFQTRPEYERDLNKPETWVPGDLVIVGNEHKPMGHIAIYYGNGYLVQSVGDRVQVSHITDWSMRSLGVPQIRHVYQPPGRLTEHSNDQPAGPITLPSGFPVPYDIPEELLWGEGQINRYVDFAIDENGFPYKTERTEFPIDEANIIEEEPVSAVSDAK